jgi:hypothetical protein
MADTSLIFVHHTENIGKMQENKKHKILLAILIKVYYTMGATPAGVMEW